MSSLPQTARPRGTTNLGAIAAVTASVATLGIVASVAAPRLPGLRPWLPVVFTAAIMAAAAGGYLLNTLARQQDRPAVAWFATGTATAGITMAVQLFGFPGVAPEGGPLSTTPDGAAWLYVVWHVAVPLSVALGLAGVGLRWRPLFVVLVTGASLTVAANDLHGVPALFTEAGAYNGLLEVMMAVLAAATVGTFLAWSRAVGTAPLGIEAWSAVSLLLCAFDVGTHAIAQERFTALWWTSLGARSGQYLVLLIGLIHHIGHHQGRLQTYTARLEEVSQSATREAVTDPLTGALNRRGLQDSLDEAWPTWAGRATVVMVDLDGFKAINDEQGHEAGDAVLAEVARALRRVTRAQDLVCRWGGDEFVVVLHAADEQQAPAMVARVTDAVHDVMAASVGWQSVDPATTSLTEALRAADVGMYAEKARRREGVRVDPVQDRPVQGRPL